MAGRTKKEAPKQGRFDRKLIDRAIELRSKEHLGIVALTRKLTEEGFKNTKGDELRPQSIRSVLMAHDAWDPRPVKKAEPEIDVKATLKAGVEAAKSSRTKTEA
jgi:hypothetical protein